jgi:HSP20 family protein
MRNPNVPVRSLTFAHPLTRTAGAPATSNLERYGLKPAPVPPVDVFEADEAWILRFDVPGVTREAIKLDLTDRLLTLETERTHANGKTARNIRRVRVPEGLDASGIKATLEHGVLEVRLPKPSGVQTRRIEIAQA